MDKGNLNVSTQDIFPIIKQFLYTDQEIFLRELVSNATDALKKINILASKNDYKEELGELKIKVSIDAKKKTLTVSDNGIGMTKEEVDKYINQIAFSSAQEFVQKYENKDDKDNSSIIGHFGLGFYSSFMVSDKVEILTQSYKKDAEPVKWSCEGSTEYKYLKANKKERGTDIILHISEDSKDYLEEFKIHNLLEKYCKFIPFDIEFGTEKIKEKVEGKKDKDGKDEEIEVEKPRIINNTNPLWMKKPTDIKPEEYKAFYSELYPLSQPPLFWIHLNVDYPFNLTGILYFPKIASNFEVQKNKIKLYSNQVFVTESVEDIVPEFLTLLHGVIDSPDIPLNVSRSSLQSDNNVKKISSYIIRKVSDKLQELFKQDRKEFEEKWDDISIFVKYGMISEEKFYEKSDKYFLLKDVEDKYHTLDEYKKKTEVNQKDKDDNLIWLYTSDMEAQYSYLDQAKKREYSTLFFNESLDSHFINFLEQKVEKTNIKRIDAGAIDELIDKGDKRESVLGKDDQDGLIELYKELINDDKIIIKAEPLSPDDLPLIITQEEFMRRMKEMSKLGGGPMFGMGEMPDSFNVVINTNHKLAKKIIDKKEKKAKKEIAKQIYDLARLSKNTLTGKELTDFISRSMSFIK